MPDRSKEVIAYLQDAPDVVRDFVGALEDRVRELETPIMNALNDVSGGHNLFNFGPWPEPPGGDWSAIGRAFQRFAYEWWASREAGLSAPDLAHDLVDRLFMAYGFGAAEVEHVLEALTTWDSGRGATSSNRACEEGCGRLATRTFGRRRLCAPCLELKQHGEER